MNKGTELVLKRTDSLDKRVDALYGFQTPKEYIKKRPGSNGLSFPYVEFKYIVGMLNSAFGPWWEWKVTDKEIGKRQLWVQGELTIKDVNTGLTISKTGFGGADIKFYKGTENAVNIGNDLKSASTTALRKAASLFGIGADVMYGELEQYAQMEDEVEEPQESEQEAVERMKLMKRMFGTAADKGVSEEDIDKVIKRQYGLESKKDLSTNQLKEIINRLESKPDKSEPKPDEGEIIVEPGDNEEDVNVDDIPDIKEEKFEEPLSKEEPEEAKTDDVSQSELFNGATENKEEDKKEDTYTSLCCNLKCTKGENGTRGKIKRGQLFCDNDCEKDYTESR